MTFVDVQGRNRAKSQDEASTAIASKLNAFIRLRMPLLFVGHIVVFSLALWLAFFLRFDFHVPQDQVLLFVISLPLVLAIKLVTFYVIGHFHGWWRHVTFADLRSLFRASVLSFLAIGIIDYFLLPWFQIPRSVLILDSMVAAFLLGAARSSWRMYREGFWETFRRLGPNIKTVLMVGANYESGIVAHQINANPDLPYRIRGFVDSDTSKCGITLGGIPVIGTTCDVSDLAVRHGATDVFVVTGTVSGKHLRDLMRQCEDAELNLKVIPPTSELLSGNGDGGIPIRDVEINDLLRREPVELDSDSIASQLTGRRVMVTGAGGSIGSEICRQVLQFQPSEIILVDHRENSVFLANNELGEKVQHTTIHPCVGDILDCDRMRQLFETHHPEYVYHAAAHKHVSLMEVNVGEAIKNNIFGTKNLADLACEFGVIKFVLISTDKAVRPTSVMGATKQIAERYIHAMAQKSPTGFICVRFGNVLGSSGSVVSIFKEQLRRGGPLTITDPRMTRFFMTIPEASQLVLQAAALGRGGEIYVLEMGEQVRIVDLAKDLIDLSGLPEGSIDIEYVGIRPGEKLFEELYFDEEEVLPTSHPKLFAAYHRPYTLSEVTVAIEQLKSMIYKPPDEIRCKLKQFVLEYDLNGVINCGVFTGDYNETA